MTLEDILRMPHEVAVQIVTGLTPEQLYASANLSPLGPQARPDRRVHALASQLAAQRFGSAPAWLMGAGKEFVQGVGSAVQGGPFFGENAYDYGDIMANETGIYGW